jgi:hypothetical protein
VFDFPERTYQVRYRSKEPLHNGLRLLFGVWVSRVKIPATAQLQCNVHVLVEMEGFDAPSDVGVVQVAKNSDCGQDLNVCQ